MPEPTAEDTRSAAREGFLGHLAGLFSASASYLRGRLELAGIEAREAAVHYAIIVGLLIAALIAVIFGYFFFCFFVIFGVAALIGGHYTWIWVTLGMAVLHFAGAVGAVFYAKNALVKPMFTETLNEFKKDERWLTPNESVN